MEMLFVLALSSTVLIIEFYVLYKYKNWYKICCWLLHRYDKTSVSAGDK